MAVSQSANIGANFSNYQGNPGLGGYGLGFGRIDTRAIEDLARYTMLYSREEYLRAQREQEKAAEELIKFTGIDLSTTIPKDAKILQEKYDKVIQYVRDNPDALSYTKDKKKWLEYNKMKSDLQNDILFAGKRSVANVARKNQIANETNEEKKKFFENQLQQNIDATDIRTPLDFVQKYDVALPEIGNNEGVKIDVTKAGSNQIFQRGLNIYDVKEGQRRGAAYAQGFSSIDPTTTTGKLKMLDANENFWRKGSDLLNQAIAGAKDPQTGQVDVSKLSDLPIMKNIEMFNEYARRMKEAVSTGLFTDQFGNKIKFSNIPFSANDYKEIDLNDGLSPVELYQVAEFSKWGGDSYDTKVISTDDAIQQRGLALEAARLAESQRQFDLNYGNESTDVRSGAYSILSTIQNAVSKGQRFNINVGTSGTGTPVGGGAIQIDDIALINQTRNIAKDGTTTEAADNVFYYPDTKKFELIYFKRDDDGNVVRGANGGGIINPDKTKTLSTSNWVESMIGDRYDARTRGRINNIVTSEIDKFGGDLVDFSKNFNISKVPLEEEGKKGKTQKTVTATGTKKRVYKGLDQNGDPVFVEE